MVIVADMQWKSAQELAAENYMMPMDPTYAPYWNGMQPGMDGFMNPYAGGMPFMGYGYNALDMPFGGVVPQGPFGAPGYMMPVVPPQRYVLVFHRSVQLFLCLKYCIRLNNIRSQQGSC